MFSGISLVGVSAHRSLGKDYYRRLEARDEGEVNTRKTPTKQIEYQERSDADKSLFKRGETRNFIREGST